MLMRHGCLLPARRLLVLLALVSAGLVLSAPAAVAQDEAGEDGYTPTVESGFTYTCAEGGTPASSQTGPDTMEPSCRERAANNVCASGTPLPANDGNVYICGFPDPVCIGGSLVDSGAEALVCRPNGHQPMVSAAACALAADRIEVSEGNSVEWIPAIGGCGVFTRRFGHLCSISGIDIGTDCVFTVLTTRGNGTINGVDEAAYQRDVDNLMRAPLGSFQSVRERGRLDHLDWSNDACSNSPDSPAPLWSLAFGGQQLANNTGFGYDFEEACLRHDFCYRNHSYLRLNRDEKSLCDLQLYDDMVASCNWWERGCKSTALLYFSFVNVGGQIPTTR